jgi:hypothetical protein
MRNAVDQNDELTPGANKASLLSGERAQPVPEPGLGSKDVKPAVRRIRPRPAIANASLKIENPPIAPPRPSVEVIEGAKKRNVDFP